MEVKALIFSGAYTTQVSGASTILKVLCGWSCYDVFEASFHLCLGKCAKNRLVKARDLELYITVAVGVVLDQELLARFLLQADYASYNFLKAGVSL